MSMLSDGIDRSFGLEGLQALGQSSNTEASRPAWMQPVEQSDNEGNQNVFNPETLDLSGCDKLTLEGAKCIGKTCKQLSSKSFSRCGDCISDAIMEVIVYHLEHIFSANLSFASK